MTNGGRGEEGESVPKRGRRSGMHGTDDDSRRDTDHSRSTAVSKQNRQPSTQGLSVSFSFFLFFFFLLPLTLDDDADHTAILARHIPHDESSRLL